MDLSDALVTMELVDAGGEPAEGAAAVTEADGALVEGAVTVDAASVTEDTLPPCSSAAVVVLRMELVLFMLTSVGLAFSNSVGG